MYKSSIQVVVIAFLTFAVLADDANQKNGNHVSLIKVMVFAPHPDDDILGCGGSLALRTPKEAQVTIVYMTSGDAEMLNGVTGRELAIIREEEAKKSAATIGVKDLIFLRHPDGKLALSEEIVLEIEALMQHHKPDIIYVPHKNDAHQDHMTTFWIVEKALLNLAHLYPEVRLPLTLCYEVWTPLQKITHSIDISSVIELKLDALSEHKSQLADTNYVDAVKALNRYRGIMTRAGDYGECFQQYELGTDMS